MDAASALSFADTENVDNDEVGDRRGDRGYFAFAFAFDFDFA
jgi:hypothetical protein